MSIKLELHVHTKYSHDSIMPFWLLYLKCAFFNISYIAITEHNNIKGALAFSDYCKKRGDKLKVIIGEEIMTTQGEIIGLFLKKEIKAGLTPDETIEEILKQKGIVYVPHPYDLKRYKTVLDEQVIKANKDKIHCIEIHNGRNISKEYDVKQKEIADKYAILPVIGSDAHTIFEIGRNYIQISKIPDTPTNFLEALRNAEFKSKECLKFCHTLTKFARVIKFIERGDFSGLYRVIHRKFIETK